MMGHLPGVEQTFIRTFTIAIQKRHWTTASRKGTDDDVFAEIDNERFERSREVASG